MSLQQAPLSAPSSAGEESATVTPGYTLSPSELAAVGYEGGFTDASSLEEWMGIVNDQSSADPGSIGVGVSGGDQEYSVGLSQINIQGNPAYATLDLLTPVTNASAAHHLFGSSGWGPWADSSGSVPANITPQDVSAATSVINNPANASAVAATANATAWDEIKYDIPSSPNIPGGVSLATLSAGNAQGSVVGTGPQPTSEVNLPPSATASAGSPSSVAPTANAGGVLGFLQTLNGYMNPKVSTTGKPSWLDIFGLAGILASQASGGISSILPVLELVGIRALVALPGVIGLLGAGVLGLFGVAGQDAAGNAPGIGGTAKAAASIAEVAA